MNKLVIKSISFFENWLTNISRKYAVAYSIECTTEEQVNYCVMLLREKDNNARCEQSPDSWKKSLQVNKVLHVRWIFATGAKYTIALPGVLSASTTQYTLTFDQVFDRIEDKAVVGIRNGMSLYYRIWVANWNRELCDKIHYIRCFTKDQVDHCVLRIVSTTPEARQWSNREYLNALHDGRPVYIRCTISTGNKLIIVYKDIEDNSVVANFEEVFEPYNALSNNPSTALPPIHRYYIGERVAHSITIGRIKPIISSQNLTSHVIEATFTGSGIRSRPGRITESRRQGCRITIGVGQECDGEDDH